MNTLILTNLLKEIYLSYLFLSLYLNTVITISTLLPFKNFLAVLIKVYNDILTN